MRKRGGGGREIERERHGVSSLECRRTLFFRISANPFNFYLRREMKKGGKVEQAEEET